MKIVILDNGHGQKHRGNVPRFGQMGNNYLNGNLTGILSAELRIY